MSHYLAEIELPSLLSEEILALIPRQRAMVNRLFSEGTLLSYSLSIDRSKLWAVFSAPTEARVDEILEGFPLRPYFHARVHELFFTQNIGTIFPSLSLN